MRRGSLPLLIGCGALFGLSFVLVRMVVGAFGPVGTTIIRTFLGGAALLAVARLRGQAPGRRAWPRLFGLGLLSAALPFSLLSVAMLSLDAGTTAVLNASAPMFAVVIDAVVRRRVPGPDRLAGLATAAAGVVLVMGSRGLGLHGSGAALGVCAGLAGAAVFAYGGFYAARHFAGSPPLGVAAGQQLAGGVLLVPVLAVGPGTRPVTQHDLVVVLLLALLGSGLAYLLFYRLIDLEGAARTANVNLLVPGFGVAWGWALLDEPVPALSVVGMVVTLGGLLLIVRPERLGEAG